MPETTFCDHDDTIDRCFLPVGGMACGYFERSEPCDGTAVKTCVDYGFYGGTTTCTDCKADSSQCNACDPSATACTTRFGFSFSNGLAVSGSHVALGSAWSIAIFDGVTFVTETAIPNLNAFVGVPNGWLVATSNPPQLSTLDTAGARGQARALPSSVAAPAMAYGAGRVLIAWNQLVGTEWHVYFAIADTSGAIVVGATDLFASDGSALDATSDGTSFFVGADGRLARVASDGAFTIANLFPEAFSPTLDVSWHGSSGWYVSWYQGTGYFSARQFDATGAMMAGHASATGGPRLDFLAHSDALLTLTQGGAAADPPRVRIGRYPASGGWSSYGVAGASPAPSYTRAAHFGSGLIVAWSAGTARLQLAVLP